MVHRVSGKGSTPYSNCLEHYWPYAGGLSAAKAIGTQMHNAINSGLTLYDSGLTVSMDVIIIIVYIAESGSKERDPRVSTNQSDSTRMWRMRGLTRDGAAEPVLDKILRRERGHKNHFSLFS